MSLTQSFYINKRKELAAQLSVESLTILFSGREVVLSEDANYPFYANNNFYYLTGIREPNVVLVLMKNKEGEVLQQLYIDESDPLKEKWVGKKIDRNEAQAVSGITEVYYNKAMATEISRMASAKTLYFDFKTPPHQSFKTADEGLQKIIKQCDLKDVYPILAQMRVLKTSAEIAAIQKANQITKAGVTEIKKLLKPGIYEYELAAFFEYFIKKEGAEGLAFETIAAAGENATILHYVSNRCAIKAGDLVLFDLGARVDGYCGDISRTLAVNAEMSSTQQKLYEIVASVQKEMFKAYKPGAAMKDLQNLTKNLFLEKCLSAGFIPANNDITEFYYHGIGHPLGLDTHDVRPPGELILKSGMVMTVEPGLYLEKIGIGIRIEDDVVITEDGCEVL
ncbi:aminopeptidase P family protein [Acetobacterium woodii]|uniref:Xaa-Pro aminopeptidase n=1 Tax=Acetobacterium woodii (strain ATCC 29683 / DSM 1030 / JCM 2381 / KCTC 1655 / WB1) TaxID=931626 RepID=H6LEG7_ACEWD|nr:aminopeptidase P family protein [Acetobacterium woodii]AFA48070.1 Xaa-Pro dipeptidase PepP [Acetobacterium woodii DSM 1030]